MQDVRKFTFDVGWVLVGSGIALVIGFALRPVLARWLGAEDLGLYSMVLTIQGVASLLTSVGIPVALTKYVAEEKNTKDKLSQTITAAFISSIITGLLVGLILYVLSGIFASLFHMPDLARLLKILAFSLPFNSILQIVLGLFTGLRQMKTYTLLTVLQNLLMTSSALILVWLGCGVDGAIWAIVFSAAGSCILGLYFSRKYLRTNFAGLFQGIKRLALFGSQVFGANALNLVLIYTDTLMIGYFMYDKDVGYYSIAISIAAILGIVPIAIQTITYPATSQYWAQDGHKSLGIMIDKSMKYSTCILLLLGLVIGFFSKELITLVFGQGYSLAVLPLIVLIIARVGSITLPVGASFSGAGRPDIVLKLSACQAVLNLVLNFLLIPPFGILGASIATATTFLIGTAVHLILMPKILKVRVDIKWFVKTMGLACIAIALFLVGREFINYYIVGGVILCAYTMLIPTVFLTSEDRYTLKSLAYSVVHRR